MNDRPLQNLGDWRAARKDMRGIWRTLGYTQEEWEVGRSVVSWDASEDYAFPTDDGYFVQGGMVAAVLDAAMAGACRTVLGPGQGFLTADLRVEFVRSTPVGRLVATATVVRATSRVVFCAGELHASDATLRATSRCTQIVLPKTTRVAGRPRSSGPIPR